MAETVVTTYPFNGEKIDTYDKHTSEEIEKILEKAQEQFLKWKKIEISERTDLLKQLGDIMENKKENYANLITKEMGKPYKESIAEIEKCIWLTDFYAKNAEDFLADQLIETEAQESFISYDPLGCILAVMPWNYPFWQVMRFAVPTVTAGNTALLKHASNTTGCAVAIENIFKEAGYPEGCFQTLIAGHEKIEEVIGNPIVKAVSLTGSEKAGKSIAATAAKHLKKSVLELGGNNACIIWDDADLKEHMSTIVKARMQNTGQSCIAAKRYIVEEGIYDEFLNTLKEEIEALKAGDPLDPHTTFGTLAREDLAEQVYDQVQESVDKGAKIEAGHHRDKAFYAPTILTNVSEGMPVFDEEVFGPVAAIVKAKDKEHSIELAANSRFGLGAMLFTSDIEKAKRMIGEIPDGAFFINELVKSDPRLPFGGTKASGYGRELSKEGIHEFVNKKTVYIN